MFIFIFHFHAIEDSTDIFGISGVGEFEHPKPPPGTPLIHTLQSRDLRLSPDSTKLLLHARYT